jgi:phospholipid/cholesterol/gamma-HCH transport system substrate-binding protein
MKISREVKIGFLALVVIVIVFWGFHFLKGKNLFNNTRTFYVLYDRIEGLNESAPVLINGYKVGIVDKIYIENKKAKRIVVKLNVDKGFDIPVNSIASIFSSDLMGTKSVKLILSDNDKICKSGDTLLPEVEAALAEQVSIQMLPLKNKAEDLMKEIQSVLEVIRYIFNENTRENLTKSIESIKLTINNLERSSSRFDTLLQNEKNKLSTIFTNIELISKNLKNSNEDIKKILSGFGNVADSMKKVDIVNTFNNLDSAVNQLKLLTKKLETGQGTLGKMFVYDSIYNNLDMTIKDLDSLLNDINRHPKKYVHFSVFGRK